MARNTLEAVFGALGAGLTGYGRDAARRREEEQTRLDRERQADRDRLAMFEAGLEPSADVQGRRQRLTQATQATQAMAGAPMPGMSAVGPALAAATRAMGEDVDRGRRITIGGTEYVQPFSRTAQGIEQRELQREAEARDRRMADEMKLIGARGAEDRRTLAARTATTQREDMNERKRRAAAEFLQAAREGVIEQDPNDQYKQRKRALNIQERKQLREDTYAAYGLNPDGSVLTAGEEAGNDMSREYDIAAELQRVIAAITASPVLSQEEKQRRIATANQRATEAMRAARGGAR